MTTVTLITGEQFDHATEEQRRARFKAMELADRISLAQGREIGHQEFEQILRAQLHRDMQAAVEPYVRMKASMLATSLSPGVIVHNNGRVETMWPKAPPAFDQIDKLIATIAERFLRNIPVYQPEGRWSQLRLNEMGEVEWVVISESEVSR